ncbi:MAG TPA: 50S ribosomal protein L18 [Candidatus Thermoplasmatota archaeon]|nr:50S ribosomal protein L18 [Candidatus Thermoplasmatota archaeon]
MADGPRYRVQFRRRREGRTDYRTRLALLKGGEPRAVVRTSLRNVVVQLVGFDASGDKVLASAEARELPKLGWTGFTRNTPSAYLTGLLAGTRAKAAGVESAVLDLGRQMPQKGGRLFAALQGLVDAGLEIPHGEEVAPAEDRIRGAHIGDEVAANFDAVKGKILETAGRE